MPNTEANRGELSDANATRLYELVNAFEDAWQSGQPPTIDEFLPADTPLHRAALIKMVHVDLEYRLKAGESVRVESYLSRYPALADETKTLRELIALEYSLRRRQEDGLAVAEYLERFPQLRDALAQQLVDTIAAPTVVNAEKKRVTASERFRILRPHKKGGLGEVFVAVDTELNREVALKEIQDKHADDRQSRARFLLEAEITGSLEHPGIVPVYGLGVYADGRPYYAMRFIRGDSLQEAIKRFHQSEPETLSKDSDRNLELRKLLGRFIDVCQAMQYAHDRGVVHRDLKPDNIMLGKYGETLVVDWGLAKARGDPSEPEASANEDIEFPLRPTSANGTAETVAGHAFGTLAFMSPEQAAGKLDTIGSASDVYSLGATLYTLVTGKLSMDGKDVLAKIKRGDYPRPRQVNAEVPTALEAICLKAMALKPADRYATPMLLADDIEHWLADEPVSAMPEPITVKAGRWARKHKPLVSGTAASLLVGLIAVSAASKANRRESLTGDSQVRDALVPIAARP
jgi:eukaryotic-like serine/threonine-protein kinase